MSVEDLRDLLPFRCSEEEAARLTQEVKEDEIKSVLFGMSNDKSPGPDGYTAEFYKTA